MNCFSIGGLLELAVAATFGAEGVKYTLAQETSYALSSIVFPGTDRIMDSGGSVVITDDVVFVERRNGSGALERYIEKADRLHSATGAPFGSAEIRSTSKLTGRTITFSGNVGRGLVVSVDAKGNELSSITQRLWPDLVPMHLLRADGDSVCTESLMVILYPGGSVYRTDMGPATRDIEADKPALVLSYLNPDQLFGNAQADFVCKSRTGTTIALEFKARSVTDVAALLKPHLETGTSYAHSIDIEIVGTLNILLSGESLTSYEVESTCKATESISKQIEGDNKKAILATWNVVHKAVLTAGE